METKDGEVIVDMWNKNDKNRYYVSHIVRVIRQDSLANGVDPEDFSEYLKDQGVRTEGTFAFVKGSLLTLAKLTLRI